MRNEMNEKKAKFMCIKTILMKVITLYANQNICINKRKICVLGMALENLMEPLEINVFIYLSFRGTFPGFPDLLVTYADSHPFPDRHFFHFPFSSCM